MVDRIEALRANDISIDNSRSYATEDALQRGLEKFGLNDIRRYTVVRNRAGRFTAIFPASEVAPAMWRAARHGFMTIG